jgi:hypothetical protein
MYITYLTRMSIHMNVPELKSLLAHNKEPIALSAPFILQNTALIGLYTSVGDSYCDPQDGVIAA